MHALEILVCILLAVTSGLLIARLSEILAAEPPVFRPNDSPRIRSRSVVICVVNLVVFVVLASRIADGSWLELLVTLAAFSMILLASVIDITDHRLPDVIVLPTLGVGVVLLAIVAFIDGSADQLRAAIVGSVLSFTVLLIAHLISPQGLGFGDVKFAALLGLLVGWRADTVADAVVLVLWFFLVGFATGTAGGVVFAVIRGRNQPFPFGPFLAFGAFAVIAASSLIVG